MTLGQNIQTARRAKGLSQEQLAGQVGVSRQALGKWEKDTALPGLDNLQALAQALEVSVDGLLGRGTAAAPALTLEDLRALLDARDAEQSKARRRTRAAVAAAGLAVLLAAWLVLAQYKTKLDTANAQLNILQAQLGAAQGSISGLNTQMQDLQDAVRQGESTVAAWEWRPMDKVHKDAAGWWLNVEVSVTPKTMAQDMAAQLVVRYGDSAEVCEMQKDAAGYRFVTGLLPLKAQQSYDVSVRWLSGDGSATTEALGELPLTQVEPRFEWIHSNNLSFGYYLVNGGLQLSSLPVDVEIEPPPWMEIRDAVLELYIDIHNAPVETVPFGSWNEQTFGAGGSYQATLPERDTPYPYQGGDVYLLVRLTDQFGGVWTSPKQPLSAIG